MKDFIKAFSLFLAYGVLCTLLGFPPIVGALFGFPVILIMTLVGSFLHVKGKSKLYQSTSLTIIIAVIVALCLADNNLNLYLIGILLHSVGIILYITTAPLLVEKVIGKKQ